MHNRTSAAAGDSLRSFGPSDPSAIDHPLPSHPLIPPLLPEFCTMTIIFRRMFPNCAIRNALRFLLAPIIAVSALLSPDISSRTLRSDEPTPMKIGIIGLDTSHATAFTKLLNGNTPKPEFAGMKVVAAYPKGSKD